MDFAIAALDFANFVNFIAVMFLTRTVVKDRKVLRGFSVSGSFLTFIAILSFEIAYFFMGNFVSLALGLVSLVFWLLAFAFTFRKFVYDKRHQQKATPDDMEKA